MMNADQRQSVVRGRSWAWPASSVVEAAFKDFIDKHQPLYKVAVGRMQEVLDKNAHMDWFDRFSGPRKGADFQVVLGMLNGGGSYGVHFVKPDGQEDLYSILGVWMVDSQGQPTFLRSHHRLRWK